MRAQGGISRNREGASDQEHARGHHLSRNPSRPPRVALAVCRVALALIRQSNGAQNEEEEGQEQEKRRRLT